MKNATYVGLCWMVTTFGLAAVALGQQQGTGPQLPALNNPNSTTADPGSPYQQPAAANNPQNSLRQPADFNQPTGDHSNKNDDSLFGAPASPDQQRALTAPGSQDRSMLSGTQKQWADWTVSGRQPRGEIGVWMIESGGPGVEVTRITSGSAADQAGLRTGDIILQVNGRGASSPQNAAQLIRQVPIGQAATLTIWRDGNQRQLQVTMKPARETIRSESREVAIREQGESGSSDLAARTIRLEQQLNSVMQELQQLRQELTQLRAAGAQPASFNSDAPQALPSTPAPTQPAAIQPQSSDANAPLPGFAPPSPPSDTPPSAAPEKPSAPPAPAKSTAPDPFGNDTAPPKADEQPKSDKDSKSTNETDSLFN